MPLGANQSASPSGPITIDSASSDSAPKRFKGSFKARKLKVLPQSTAEDDAWKRDDGKFGSGPGEIEIEIGPHGVVTGEVRGPWGTLDLNGEVSEDELTATLRAHDDDNGASAHGAFNGVVSARLVDGAIDAKMRVSSGDAVIARDAESHLEAAH